MTEELDKKVLDDQGLNFSQDLRIDPDALDLEWLEQPRLFMRWAELLADAEDDMDQLKNELEIKEAQLDAEIRRNPPEGMKLTETSISGWVTSHSARKALLDQFLEAKKKYNLMRSAVRAFEQRKEALENLVKLHGQSYFAGPKTPRNLSEEADIRKQTREARQEGVRQKITRRMQGG